MHAELQLDREELPWVLVVAGPPWLPQVPASHQLALSAPMRDAKTLPGRTRWPNTWPNERQQVA